MCRRPGGPQRVGLALAGPGLWQGGAGREAQEGRDISPIPPSSNYGFVILLPIEQAWRAPSLTPHSAGPCTMLWEETKGKPVRKQRPPCAWDLARPQEL